MANNSYTRIASLKTAEDFERHLQEIGIQLPNDPAWSGPDSALGQPFALGSRTIGNRFAILPMEGWDGTPDGSPTEFTRRRWANFGESGAKLIWGGEAFAVRHDGRANPNQLLIDQSKKECIQSLRRLLVESHRQSFGNTDDLLIGLQLTHSGRFANPNEHNQPEPRIVYRHPLLDARSKSKIDDRVVLTDDELDELAETFVEAAAVASDAGFDFVDIKHCHGYLGHELLTAFERPGRYGGSLENRTRFLRTIVEGIRATTHLAIGVRISIFDFAPFEAVDESRIGTAQVDPPYRYAFGGDGSGVGLDLREPIELLQLLRDWDVRFICTTAGCPYYCPHIQRPAIYPPSDGYLPPEDPTVGVARQIAATAELKALFPDIVFVGSGYSYLQEWLPHVASGAVRSNQVDFVGLGRMVLAYPRLPIDVLSGRGLDRKRICRTFSDCTTAPRNGLVSGCYPLDPFYKQQPQHAELVELKKQAKA